MPTDDDNAGIGIIVPLALVLLIATPALAMLAGASFVDVVRGMVLMMTLIMAGLYTGTLVNIAYQARRIPDELVRQMAFGRGLRIMACLLFMSLGTVDLVDRFGDSSLAWFTPTLGAADLLMLGAWMLVDTRRWKEPDR